MTGRQAASFSTKNNKGEPVLYAGDRLTKDQLEILVEKHKKGVLTRGGQVMIRQGECKYFDDAPGCAMQHLNHDPIPLTAFASNKAVAAWFDNAYQPTWADWMLREAMVNAKLIEE